MTVSDPRGVENLDALDAIYHWTELIQSSPLAVERSVHGAIGGAYRSQGITTLELRFNPMKRNRGGERDLDHIILAAIRGLDRASLEYPLVRAGLILMMDRTFDARQNEIIVEKAIALVRTAASSASTSPGRGRAGAATTTPRSRRWSTRPARQGSGSRSTSARRARPAPRRSARSSSRLRPDRIGHGILAARDPELMRALHESGTVLEICPTSNLLTKALPDEDAVRDTFRTFVEHGVAFTIATDGPEMMGTHLRDEFELLAAHRRALRGRAAVAANARGHAASFIGSPRPRARRLARSARRRSRPAPTTAALPRAASIERIRAAAGARPAASRPGTGRAGEMSPARCGGVPTWTPIEPAGSAE